MSKQSRGKSWLDFRVADRLEAGPASYSVDLVARRGTGIHGFRTTVVFMPLQGGAEVAVELPNAASTADVHRLARELSDAPRRLLELLASGRTA